ncbi:MAG: metallophosphoesterase [bacterium]|nr:metallophosphoesterase [bacterium]
MTSESPAGSVLRTGLAALGVATAAGAGVLGWSLAQAAWGHRIRELDLTPSPAPAELTVLHLSDMHLLPRLAARRRFLRSLAERTRPDLVVFTGDALASPAAVPAVLRDMDALLDLPGVFVFGSNDYVGPSFKNPLQYFRKSAPTHRSEPQKLPAEAFADALRRRGWLDLRNARGQLTVKGVELSFVGVDDPHIDLDSLPADDGLRGHLHIGVGHAPYLRTLDEFRADGCDVALFGHTHGGQICVPGYGALVTNSDLPTWRASGLQGWPGLRPDGLAITPRPPFAPVPPVLPDDGREPMWVNISAGLGTSPYAPIRLACPPEVSVVRFAPVGFRSEAEPRI